MEIIDQKESSPNSSNYNSTQRTWKYDIFLSFRGEDTRKGFIDHLYHALNKRGFKVFRDDHELERGEVISEKLKQAIEDSLFAIVVLSRNYASSSWCLDELKHILYSRNNLCRQVFPIFYGIDPSDVRHQTGSFAEAFARHQMLQRNNKDMESWKDSLTKVADLSGWDCKDQHEAELIDLVVEELWTKLRSRLPPYCEDLIGIDDKVQQLEPLLKIGLKDVRFVGLWGLAGVGKTTIARAVFEKYRSEFDMSCFLLNVRATSLERDGEVRLQSKLLSNLKLGNVEIEDAYEGKKMIQNRLRDKKVLLILDDVSHTTHFEILANSPDWFGAGSRVIITTRDSDLLRRVHEVYKHEVKTMNSRESLQLFCQKAFGRGEPQEDLLELSKSVCDYAKGLPLALSVLGSHFCGKIVSEWKDALDMLKEDPHRDIISSLKISFDALTKIEKTIFLDIACFFSGWRKNIIIQILESCGFNNAKARIKALQRKSLLEDYGDCLVMHDLLVQMGRKIVAEASTDVGHHTRLWYEKDIDTVMKNNLGTKEIQGMVSPTPCEACWDPEAFSALCNLRLLIIVTSDFNLACGLHYLSHALKVLHWTKYPLDSLPSGTQLDKLIDLRMHYSKLKKLWTKSLCSRNLKFLDLSYSINLIETPDFSELPNLERLELEGCEALADLHASIGQHKKVQVLNLKGCKNLRARCPKKLEMGALKEFFLCGCIRVKYLPEFGESMKNLEMLDAAETNLVKLPESLGLLSGLKTLKLEGCKNLVCLPQSIHKLKRLVLLDIAGCSKFSRLPENLNEMEALEEIDVSETDINEAPSSIGGLKKLKKLSFQGKRSMTNSWSLFYPLSHRVRWRSTHDSLTLPASIFNLKSLKKLNLSYCNFDDGSVPYSFSGLSSLKELNLSGNKFKNLPAGCISNLLNLQYLLLNSCLELRSLPQSEPSLFRVDAKECGSLETMSDEQLSQLFASIDQNGSWMVGETLAVTIPGSEIPSWFENQIDLCLDDRGEALMMIDTPPCGEEMLGIGFCFVLNEERLAYLRCYFDFAALPYPWCTDGLGRFGWDLGVESGHLSMLFWKQREELSRILQLSEYSHIPVRFSASRSWWNMDANFSLKCGWRVISKRDFENRDNSMSHDLLPAAEQHNDQAIRTPIPLEGGLRSVSVRRPNIKLDDFKEQYCKARFAEWLADAC